MRVQFADPQPGVFPVGLSSGSVLFVDGVADVEPMHFAEMQRLELAVIAVPDEADETPESVAQPTEDAPQQPAATGSRRTARGGRSAQ